jgi:hypothetical protein
VRCAGDGVRKIQGGVAGEERRKLKEASAHDDVIPAGLYQ